MDFTFKYQYNEHRYKLKESNKNVCSAFELYISIVISPIVFQ